MAVDYQKEFAQYLKYQSFTQACKDGSHDVVEALLLDGFIPKTNHMTTACKKGDQTLVLKLLQYQNLDVQEGFIQAVKNNHFHLISTSRIDMVLRHFT